MMNDTRTHTRDQVAISTLGLLSQRVIEASVEELRREDELTLGIREMFRQGLDVNELSAATGLPPRDIRRRLECELYLGEDTERLFTN